MEELIRVSRDSRGRLNYISADTETLNRLLPEIESGVKKRLPRELDGKNLLHAVPFRGAGVFAAVARLGFKAQYDNSVNAEFESEFTHPDANHTYCVIYLKVRTGIIAALFLTRRHMEIETVIPFAEALIAG